MIMDYLEGLFEASGTFLMYVLPLAAIWWLFNQLKQMKSEGFLGIFLISAVIYGGFGLYGTYWLHSQGFEHYMWNLGFWSIVYLIYITRATAHMGKKQDEDE